MSRTRKNGGVLYVICGKCGVEKSSANFAQSPRRHDGFSAWCRKCHAEYHDGRYSGRVRQKIIDRAREAHLLKNFNMTPEQWDAKCREQGYVCAICKNPETKLAKHGGIKRLSVDHDHNTGKVRGLLCHDCNLMVFWIETRLHLIPEMKKYLGMET